jgi:hypothetical protein
MTSKLIDLLNYSLLIESYSWYFTGVFTVLFCRHYIRLSSNFFGQIILLVLTLLVIGELLFWFYLPEISSYLIGKTYKIPNDRVWGFFIGGFSYLALSGLKARYIEPFLNYFREKVTRQSGLRRQGKSDMKSLDTTLPVRKNYNVEAGFGKKKGIQIAKNIYIPHEDWKRSNKQIIGSPGMGKSAALTAALGDCLNHGQGVLLIDPKGDKLQKKALFQIADSLNLPSIHIDLNTNKTKINSVSNKKKVKITEQLIASLSIGDTGRDSDFFKSIARSLAYRLGELIEQTGSFKESYQRLLGETKVDRDNSKFFQDVEDLLRVECIFDENSPLSIEDVLQAGGLVYITGSMINTTIQKAQKFILVGIVQYIFDRKDKSRFINVAVEELSVVVSRILILALSAIRSNNSALCICHQSISDLRDCPSDINPDVAANRILNNCPIKLVYRVPEYETASKLALLSGTTETQESSTEFVVNNGLAEIQTEKRILNQVSRNVITENELMLLPPGVAALYGLGPAKLVTTSHIQINNISTDKPNRPATSIAAEDLIDVD